MKSLAILTNINLKLIAMIDVYILQILSTTHFFMELFDFLGGC